METLAGLDAARYDHIVFAAQVSHAQRLARPHARRARNGDRLNWVCVAKRAAPSLVCLAVAQPAVDAPARHAKHTGRCTW